MVAVRKQASNYPQMRGRVQIRMRIVSCVGAGTSAFCVRRLTSMGRILREAIAYM